MFPSSECDPVDTERCKSQTKIVTPWYLHCSDQSPPIFGHWGVRAWLSLQQRWHELPLNMLVLIHQNLVNIRNYLFVFTILHEDFKYLISEAVVCLKWQSRVPSLWGIWMLEGGILTFVWSDFKDKRNPSICKYWRKQGKRHIRAELSWLWYSVLSNLKMFGKILMWFTLLSSDWDWDWAWAWDWVLGLGTRIGDWGWGLGLGTGKIPSKFYHA